MLAVDAVGQRVGQKGIDMSTEKIAVCCNSPLVFTFVFSGAEWYCRTCKGAFGIFDVEYIPVTPELVDERDRNKALFLSIAKDVIPRGSRRINCELCANGEYHANHAAEDEIKKSTAAYLELTGSN